MTILMRPGRWLPVLVLLLAACGGGELARVRIASGPPLAWGLDATGPIRRAASGTYVVQPGDTLWAIATVHELDPEDLAVWNHIRDPDMLLVGQRLQVRSPSKVVSRPGSRREPEPVVVGAALRPPAGTRVVEEVDLPPAPSAAPPSPPAPSPSHAAPPPASSHAAPAPPAPVVTAPPAPVVVAESGPAGEHAPAAASPAPAPKNTWILKAEAPKAWIWPARGKVIRKFGLSGSRKSTGIDIAVKVGEPVLAAADGVVVYADDGLPGYGKMIILRHGGSYMTAYAHNDAILVRQGDRVNAGQAIAKAGQSGRVSSPRLHFELRRGVKPVDPMGYLPKV